METETKSVERDGKEYECSPVFHERKQVGFAPRRSFESDEEMLEHFGLSILCGLADRQYNQDTKNKVRAKFLKGAVSPSAIVKSIAAGEISVDDINDIINQKGLSFTAAAASLMGVGADAKSEPDKIHWDVL